MDMQFYFRLQIARIKRWLTTLGVNPIFAIIISVLLFIGLSRYLFVKVSSAPWLYFVISAWSIYQLSEWLRNSQLRYIFSDKSYLMVRFIENGLMALPFSIYLLYEKAFIQFFTLIGLCIILTFVISKPLLAFTFPTPFRKIPFEYIVGFRTTFYQLFTAYFILFQAIKADNYNLGIFTLVIILFVCMSFYKKTESKYFVWIYRDNPKGFLFKKLYISIIGMWILIFPILISLLIGFREQWTTTFLILICCHIALGSVIFAKYSSFPQSMSLPQGILFGVSLLVPPVFPFVIWLFYKQSIKRLNPILT